MLETFAPLRGFWVYKLLTLDNRIPFLNTATQEVEKEFTLIEARVEEVNMEKNTFTLSYFHWRTRNTKPIVQFSYKEWLYKAILDLHLKLNKLWMLKSVF